MHSRVVKYVYSDELIRQADKNPVVKGRASLTHELIRSYGLLQSMEVLHPKSCNAADLRGFHSRDYIEQLRSYTKQPDDTDSADESDGDDSTDISEEYGLGFDCPTWWNIIDYACTLAGATMSACDALCRRAAAAPPEVFVNWTGGWHHAHRDKAAGYCYINDIVLGILVLRKRYQRVLYIDLDVHHGDGVEEAFATTKRVFTLSFHKYECGYYPGSGGSNDCGMSGGRGYAANFPYQSGISGHKFKTYFERITTKVLGRYQPDACVLQCGADAIVSDPLGGTNLVPADLIHCIGFVLQRQLPTIILGGGGYNLPNTSRYWAQITAAVCGQTLSDDIPSENEHFLKYGPDYGLQITERTFMHDLNTDAYLENCANIIEENLIKCQVSDI